MNTLSLLQKMAKNINSHTSINQPYINKFTRIAGIYIKQEKISEISVNTFNELTGLKKDIALTVLKNLNSKVFQK